MERLDHVEAALLDLEDVRDETCRPWAHQLELLQTIPGVEVKVAQVIIAEGWLAAGCGLRTRG